MLLCELFAHLDIYRFLFVFFLIVAHEGDQMVEEQNKAKFGNLF